MAAIVSSHRMMVAAYNHDHLRVCTACVEEIVALKRLKMEKEKEGFPITSLREINTLLKAQHPNIVTVRVRTVCT